MAYGGFILANSTPIWCRFDDYECLTATRLSLLRADIHKNRALQIGNLDSDSTKELLKSEQKLLIRLSEAARDSQKLQIALNSITRANNGALQNEFDFAQEFASVMWTQQEQKMAVEFLKQFLARPIDKRTRSPKDVISTAQLLSLAVSLFLLHDKPFYNRSCREHGYRMLV